MKFHIKRRSFHGDLSCSANVDVISNKFFKIIFLFRTCFFNSHELLYKFLLMDLFSHAFL